MHIFLVPDASKSKGTTGAELELHCPIYSVTGMSFTWTRVRDNLPPGAVSEGSVLR